MPSHRRLAARRRQPGAALCAAIRSRQAQGSCGGRAGRGVGAGHAASLGPARQLRSGQPRTAARAAGGVEAANRHHRRRLGPRLRAAAALQAALSRRFRRLLLGPGARAKGARARHARRDGRGRAAARRMARGARARRAPPSRRRLPRGRRAGCRRWSSGCDYRRASGARATASTRRSRRGSTCCRSGATRIS